MKLTMIAILWILGMIVDVLWGLTDKDEVQTFMKIINETEGIERLPKELTMAIVSILLIIGSIFWPTELISYPYSVLKKKSL